MISKEQIAAAASAFSELVAEVNYSDDETIGEAFREFIANYGIESVQTFEEVGMMTMNAGIQINTMEGRVQAEMVYAGNGW